LNSNSEIKDLESLYPYLQLDENYSFVVSKRTQSRHDSDLYFVKYQEYYKGVKVSGGTVFRPDGPPTPFDPCNDQPFQPSFIQPTIYSDINIDINPSINKTDLGEIIHAQVDNVELMISHGLATECNYNLVWVVDYYSDFKHRAWIDAHSGNVLKSDIFGHNGISFLDKIKSNINSDDNLIENFIAINSTVVGDDDIVISYSNNCNGPTFGTNGLDDYLSGGTNVCPITEEETPVEFAIREKIQKVREDLEEIIGVNFNTNEVNTTNHFMIGCSDEQAFNLGWSDFNSTTYTYMDLDFFEGDGLPTADILAHELAHSYTNLFFNSNFSNESFSLHEGISDIFGMYLESICSNEPMDSVIGDKVGSDFRDASNPPADCWDDVAVGHTQGNFLTNWFWELSKFYDEKLLMEVLVDAMQSLDDENATIEGFYQAVLNIVTQIRPEEGLCSNLGKSIVRQFNKMCIGDPSDICPSFRIDGPLSFCEENEDPIFLRITNLDGIHTDGDYRWHLPRDWDIVQANGNPYPTSGNNNNYENNFIYLDPPDYPYYPIDFQICVSQQAGEFGRQRKCFTFQLSDCDSSGPTCEEYFGLDGFTQNSVLKSRTKSSDSLYSNIYSSSHAPIMRVFTISGILLYQGGRLSLENENNMLNSSNQILIFVEYDSNGKLLRTRKKFLKN